VGESVWLCVFYDGLQSAELEDKSCWRRPIIMATYSGSHLLPSGIMAISVTFSEYIVFARLKASSMIVPRGSSIR
jgi:hypothetical protein